jgi:hypothetical protein
MKSGRMPACWCANIVPVRPAHGDLVDHQVHLVAVAQRARQAQVFGVVHGHAGGALHSGSTMKAAVVL